MLLCFLLLFPAEGCTAHQAETGEAGIGDVSAAAVPETSASTPVGCDFSRKIEGHSLVAENEKLELYLYPQTLSILIRVKKTGAILRSTVSDEKTGSEKLWTNFMKSGVVMEYYKNVDTVTNNADLISTPHTLKVSYIQGGFQATVFFNELHLGYTLIVKLTEGGITAEIPRNTIVDGKDTYAVGGFYVYPFLGYSYLGRDSGYMFVPDGCGMLIDLKNNHGKYQQPYSQMVYGANVGVDVPYVESLFQDKLQMVNQPENILAPVFGMVHTGEGVGFLGIIEGGDYSAEIVAYPNGVVTQYDWISAKFIYRQVYVQPTSKSGGSISVRQPELNHFDVKLRYQIVSGDDANYMGLAKAYRDYLLQNGMVQNRDCAFRVRLDFLGEDKKNWLLFKKKVPMTTSRQVQGIISDLRNSGVKDILAVYKGWQSGGVNSFPVLRFKADKALGGNGELRSLLTQMKEWNVPFYLEQDALRLNPEEVFSLRYSLAKKQNQKLYEEETHKDVYPSFYYLTPGQSARILKATKDDFSRNGVEHIMLSGISDTLFSYYSDRTVCDRVSSAAAYKKAISDYAGAFDVMLKHPYAYLWKYTSAVTDLPMETSHYIFESNAIPFFAIVLKGIMPVYAEYQNFQANSSEYFLMLVEQGIYPSFLLTAGDPADLLYTNSSDDFSSQYGLYKNTIRQYYSELRKVSELVKNSRISNYTKKDGVSKVTYENGTVIYVNFNHAPTVCDGVSLGALSYKVGGNQ